MQEQPGFAGTRQKLSAPHAALVNGTQVQGFELDDVHRQGVLHVGAVTLDDAARGWLEALLGHFCDPAVALAAPRIVGLGHSDQLVARYEADLAACDRMREIAATVAT